MFVHLHTHTEHSPLDGLTQVGQLAAHEEAAGASAVAITDHGSIMGWRALHRACRGRSLFPIYGVEAYLAIGGRFDRQVLEVPGDSGSVDREDAGTKTRRYYHITLLAENEDGYRNIIRMMNAAEDSYWYHPQVDYDLLEQFGRGVIVLSGCLGGPVATHLSMGDEQGARDALDRMIRAVGKDNVYVEVMSHGIAGEEETAPLLADLAEEYDLPLVATNDAHFLDESHDVAHDAWLCLSTHKRVKDSDRFRFNGQGYHVRSEAQMRALRSEDWWGRACDETVRLAQRIGRDVAPEPSSLLPHFDLPDGWESSVRYFHHLVKRGALAKYGEDPARPGHLPKRVADRLRWESTVITGADVADYFLILHDLIRWCHSTDPLPGDEGVKKPIRTGPGRGSAAGSCVAYCLGITNVDPLEHGLLFERFLNPERVGLPDIDTDFERGRRLEVLEYLQRRYGVDHVARVGTFGIDRSRQALKDAARVLDVPSVGVQLAEQVPVFEGAPLPIDAVAVGDDPVGEPFRRVMRKHGEDASRVLDVARVMEGSVRSNSIHACATIVADAPLGELVPLRYERVKGEPVEGAPRVAGWEGGDLEEIGLLKLDVLGLKTLDLIALACDMVRANYGVDVDFSVLRPGSDTSEVGRERDRLAFELIAQGRTAGVFQLGSDGMKKLAREVGPTNIADVTALVALYRPGPMAADMHHTYARRKNGREAVSYDDLTGRADEQRVIASVLDETFGTCCFQEQLMALGSAVGGLDAAWTNRLRKAFSKKQKNLMNEVRAVFFEGAQSGKGPEGVRFSLSTLEGLWRVFEGSASYLFNKSHAACYAHVAWQCAYLKASWPAEFGAAVLAITERSKDRERADMLSSLTAEGVQICAPDVNSSAVSTTAVGGKVLMGLGEVKGVGKAGEAIVAEREESGPFTSLADLMRRIAPKKMTMGAVEALVDAGALDAFGSRLGVLMVCRAAREWDVPVPRFSFGVLEADARQRARLGAGLGVSPLVRLSGEVGEWCEARGFDVVDISDVGVGDAGARVRVVGVLTGWDVRQGRKSRYVRVELEGSDRRVVTGVGFSRVVESVERSEDAPRVGDVVCALVDVEVTGGESVDSDDGEEPSEAYVQVKVASVERVGVVDCGRRPNMGLRDPRRVRVVESVLDVTDQCAASAWIHDDVRDVRFFNAPEGCEEHVVVVGAGNVLAWASARPRFGWR